MKQLLKSHKTAVARIYKRCSKQKQRALHAIGDRSPPVVACSCARHLNINLVVSNQLGGFFNLWGLSVRGENNEAEFCLCCRLRYWGLFFPCILN